MYTLGLYSDNIYTYKHFFIVSKHLNRYDCLITENSYIVLAHPCYFCNQHETSKPYNNVSYG